VLSQERLNGRTPPCQRPGIAGQQYHVIDIAQVVAALELALDEMVDLVEIHITPELTGEITDGQTPLVLFPEQAFVREHRIVWVPGTRGPSATALKAVVGGGVVEQQCLGEPPKFRIGNLARNDLVKNRFIDGRKEIRHIQLQRPSRTPAVGRCPVQKNHEPVTGRQRALALAAGIGVVNEHRLEHPLLVRDQQVMHHAVAKIGREHLARFWARRDKTDRAARSVAVGTQFPLQCQQIGLRVEFKPESVVGVALVAAALAILPPQGLEGKNVGTDHRPPRTARTRLSLFLLLLFTLSLLKLTFHALFGLLALDVDDQ